MVQKQVEYIAQFRKESRGDSMSKLKIVYKHVDEIIPYVNNPRKISQNAIDMVASSIKNLFTFYSSSIKGKSRFYIDEINKYLHSTLVLLKFK